MKRFVLATFIVLLAGGPVLAGVAALAPDKTMISATSLAIIPEESSCQPYGCEARVLSLKSDRYVIMGSIRLPVTWSGNAKPPAAFARITVLHANPTGPVLEQLIAINWSRVDYFCCCPSEWYGEFKAELRLDVKPGTQLLIEIGKSEICTTTVTVPDPSQPQLNPLPVGTMLVPADAF